MGNSPGELNSPNTTSLSLATMAPFDLLCSIFAFEVDVDGSGGRGEVDGLRFFLLSLTLDFFFDGGFPSGFTVALNSFNSRANLSLSSLATSRNGFLSLADNACL